MEQRSAIDIHALNRFLEAIGSDTPDLIFYPGPVQSIHHYTDLEALQGIIANHDLWLTHSRYSNDAEELTHGHRIVNEVIKEELAVRGNRGYKIYLKQVAEILRVPPSEGVYICCFCQDDNLLSQWRAYGENGIGVCLGFNPADFSYITGPDSPPRGLIRLWTVNYDPDRQRNLVRRALDFAFADRSSWSIKRRARQAADAILFFIPTFKNQDFKEEDEVRLIFTPEPGFSTQPKFRVARGMLVPYYSLKELSGSLPSSHRLPITGVRVGPSVNKRMNVESVRMLLTNAGYKGVDVKSSDTPYRG